jgi:hypothetical protein
MVNRCASALFLISALLYGTALAEDDTKKDEVTAEEEVTLEAEEQTECAPAEFYCDYYPPLFGLSCGSVSGGCIGKECQGMNRGLEAKFIPLGGLPFTDWMAMTKGDFVPVGLECVVDTDNPTPPHIIRFDTGVAGHCAALLITEEHFFVEFFAGVSYCSGWVECQCS